MFRLQFLQSYLTGPTDVMWRELTDCILRQAADLALFKMDFNLFKLCGLSPFYQSLFKAWTCFEWKRPGPACSLHWPLQEPLVYGARLDI